MPLGVYREVPAVLERGALVSICLPEAVARLGRERRYLPAGECPGGVGRVVKQIAAVPGDRVVLGPGGMAVNGRLVEGAGLHRRDSAGRELAHEAFGEHAVGAEELWVLGAHGERSWDSRYFGPVRSGNVVASVRPVLTFGAWPTTQRELR